MFLKSWHFLWVLLFIGVSCPSWADPTPTPSVNSKGLPRISVIPNPAYGAKVTFRIMTAVPSKVKIRVYNRFFDNVATLTKEGKGLFDILWSLKGVSEGIYHFQAQIEDKTTGQVCQLPIQKFVVMK